MASNESNQTFSIQDLEISSKINSFRFIGIDKNKKETPLVPLFANHLLINKENNETWASLE
jgi:hypothetical protein